MAIEYIADIEVLAAANVYIGSSSNMVFVILAKRQAYSVKQEKPPVRLPPCYIDSVQESAPLVCEGHPAMTHFLCSFMGLCNPHRLHA
jgi:hypothetical protein